MYACLELGKYRIRNTYKHISVDKMPIKDLAQKITAKGEGSKGITKGEYKNLRKKTPSNEIR
ncbi:hypothetical protein ACIQZM_20730, partial [Peribacillus sp. NPDC097206]|uniref:hypothetical protein n=1 Tax=Peribacillus sp. NPDC097206 TaxID=3364398 RepID=UPI0037FA0714